jgi:hypothetical protein
MVLLLSFAALIVALLGGFRLTQETLGIGALAVACILVLFARMAQAAHHHAELLRAQKLQVGSDSRPSLEGNWVCWTCGRVNRPQVFDCAYCETERPAAAR